MWEAYINGTVPVGAVIVDPGGEVVACGLNRIFDGTVDGQLASTRLAHAEVNALVQLGSDRTYEDFHLYTALEPCHLCLAATIAARVGTLHYAARDRYGGAVGKLLPSADHLAHPMNIAGPLREVAGRLPETLLVAHVLWRQPDGEVARFYERIDPAIVAIARTLPAPDAGATLEDAFAALTH